MITSALSTPGPTASSTGAASLAPTALPGSVALEPSFGSELRRANLQAAGRDGQTGNATERSEHNERELEPAQRGRDRIAARRGAMPPGAATRGGGALQPDAESSSAARPLDAADTDIGLADDTKSDADASTDLSTWVAGLMGPAGPAIPAAHAASPALAPTPATELDSIEAATTAVAGRRGHPGQPGVATAADGDGLLAARAHRASPTSIAAAAGASAPDAADPAAAADGAGQTIAAPQTHELMALFAANASDSRASAATAATGSAGIAGIAGIAAAAPAGTPLATAEAAAGAQISPTLGSPEFAPALGTQIVVLVRQGIEQARLQINPAEMGPIAVQLALDGNTVRIEMVAEQGATRTLLEQSLPTLAASLRDAGFTLGGGGVFGQAQNGASGHDGAAAALRQTQDQVDLDAGTAGDTATVGPRMLRSRGLVDIYA